MSAIKETINGLRVGDKIESELGEDSFTGRVITTRGVVRNILAENRILVAKDIATDVFLELNADECVKVFDCSECEDIGYITIPAHQAYSPTRGTYIEDDKDYPCPSCKAHNEDDYDQN